MYLPEKYNDYFNDQAREISSKYEFTYEDSISALCRAYKYFLDIGQEDESAGDSAVKLVTRALEAAPRFGFELRPMVDYMLFSIFHRVPSVNQFIR